MNFVLRSVAKPQARKQPVLSHSLVIQKGEDMPGYQHRKHKVADDEVENYYNYYNGQQPV